MVAEFALALYVVFFKRPALDLALETFIEATKLQEQERVASQNVEAARVIIKLIL